MNKILGALLIGLMLTVGGSIARAGSLEDGVAALQRGDYATALRVFQPLAAQGDAIAQNNLGAMYENGSGVPQDYREAAKWYQLSAAQGNVRAQSNLGLIYVNGLGIRKDYNEALKLFRFAAAQGYAPAQNDLGFM